MQVEKILQGQKSQRCDTSRCEKVRSENFISLSKERDFNGFFFF
jgi:hypothetical protein